MGEPGRTPILGDHYAAEAVDRIDYDFAELARRVRPQSNQYLVTLRARQLDDWSTDFLACHPDATVLQLGCGLDSRMLRLDPPATVRWFDLDIPKVIELRRRLHPGIRDGREVERWNPRLTCAAQLPFGTRYALIPVRRYRALYRLGNRVPGWRTALRNFRFAFESPTPSR